MEKIIIKTIREAIKLAYYKKMLSESSEDVAKVLAPDKLRDAEALYRLFVTNRVAPGFDGGSAKTTQTLIGKGGKKMLRDRRFYYDNKMINYVIEKAVEEYKQTKDSRIRDAVAGIYDPGRSQKIYNILLKTPGVITAIKGAFGNDYSEQDVMDVFKTAWIEFILDPAGFDNIIDHYQEGGQTGIGALFLSRLKSGAQTLSKRVAAKKRGGAGQKRYVPEECKETLTRVIAEPTPTAKIGNAMTLRGYADQFEGKNFIQKRANISVFIPEDSIEEFVRLASSIVDEDGNAAYRVSVTTDKIQREIPGCAPAYGQEKMSIDSPSDIIRMKGGQSFSDDDSGEGESEDSEGFDVEDESDSSVASSESGALDKLKKTFNDASEYFLEAADKGALPDKVAFLFSEMFKNGKTTGEVYDENPEVFAGILKKSLTAYPTQYFGSKTKWFSAIENIGVKNGLPSGWIEKLMTELKSPFFGVVKFIRAEKEREQVSESVERILSENKTVKINAKFVLEELYKRLGNV